jgi:Ca-activated chloride channel homolog
VRALPEELRESSMLIELNEINELNETGNGSPRPDSAHRPRRALLCLALSLLLAPAAAMASPSSALREYRAGQYEAALKEYQRLLERKTDDPRLRFNAGTAAYRNRQFADAAKQFDEALASPQTASDLKLQELAYYNRGNSLYHLGESLPDPAKKTETWQKSLKDFESSLHLNSQDSDAKFNYEFVKKRLEELKQQQQQQDKQDKQDKQQNQDQQQQNQQSSRQDQQDQKQPEQQQQQAGQKQNPGEEQKDQESQQPKPQDQAPPQAGQKPEDQKPQEQQQAGQPAGESKDKGDQQEEQAANLAPGQMTPDQARRLLDAQKGDERMLPVKPEGKPVDNTRLVRDW